MNPSVVIVYIHVPFDATHEQMAKEFVKSYLSFPPEYSHRTLIICQHREPDQAMRELFERSLPECSFHVHDDSGWDIGGFQAAAVICKDDMMVCFGGPSLFTKAGWLDRMVDAWIKHGSGFYGTASNFEVSPHIQTSAFWCSPSLITSYPTKVVTKEQRWDFEHGPNALWKQVAASGGKVLLVTWDGEYEWQHWRTPPNIYRRGDQSNCLALISHGIQWKTLQSHEKAAFGVSSDTLSDPKYIALTKGPIPEQDSHRLEIASGRHFRTCHGFAERRTNVPTVCMVYIFVPNIDSYAALARRFVTSYLLNPPGEHHSTIIVSQGEIPDRMRTLFDALPQCRVVTGDNSGWDIGAYITAARTSKEDILLCCGSSCHFLRSGWLSRIVDAWVTHGPGFYGSASSFEVTPHLPTSSFWVSPPLLSDYPIAVVTREQRYDFEHGPNSFCAFVRKKGFPVKLVTWTGEYDEPLWRSPPNIFRRGTQQECLIWDRHMREYVGSPSSRKAQLSAMSDGKASPNPVQVIIKSITIVAVTSLSPNSHAEAIRRTAAALPFECEQVLISPRKPDNFAGRWDAVPEWMPDGKWELEDMCDFLMYGLVDHIHTDAAILVQWDGYAVNRHKWTDAFLNYDYIGAPWPKAWCINGKGRIGNGGFSLRSRKWLEAATKLPCPPREMERSEDMYQCQRQLRHFEKAGCKVAPLPIAAQWSLELNVEEYPKWTLSDSFGFHGLTDSDPARSNLKLARND